MAVPVNNSRGKVQNGAVTIAHGQCMTSSDFSPTSTIPSIARIIMVIPVNFLVDIGRCFLISGIVLFGHPLPEGIDSCTDERPELDVMFHCATKGRHHIDRMALQ